MLDCKVNEVARKSFALQEPDQRVDLDPREVDAIVELLVGHHDHRTIEQVPPQNFLNRQTTQVVMCRTAELGDDLRHFLAGVEEEIEIGQSQGVARKLITDARRDAAAWISDVDVDQLERLAPAHQLLVEVDREHEVRPALRVTQRAVYEGREDFKDPRDRDFALESGVIVEIELETQAVRDFFDPENGSKRPELIAQGPAGRLQLLAISSRIDGAPQQ